MTAHVVLAALLALVATAGAGAALTQEPGVTPATLLGLARSCSTSLRVRWTVSSGLYASS